MMREIAVVLIFLGASVLDVDAQDALWEMRCPDGMIYVPAGEFVMGSKGSKDELVRRVYVSAFYIDQYLVTNAQFKVFVDATGHRTLAEDMGRSVIPQPRRSSSSMVTGAYWRAPEGPVSTIEGRMDHPVVHMAYPDAVAYCQWAGKRLPTEAEWEKACRGTDGRRQPWGDGWKPGRHTRVKATPRK